MTQTTAGRESPASILARSATTASSDRSPVARWRPFAIARRRPRRIGLFGLFGCGNAGNDGSLEAMLTFLRRVRPDAALICFCAYSDGATDQIARDFRITALPIGLRQPANGLLRILDRLSWGGPRQLASLIRAIGHARRLDLLIIPGTGILDDFQAGPLGIPLALFGWCLAARLCGTRIAFVSIGAGPIHHPLSRWLMKSAVAMAQYRSYRDTLSKAFMESIGFDTQNDAIYPDIAFKLPAPSSPVQAAAAGGESLNVGVGVMTYLGWRRDDPLGPAIYATYLEKITTFVLWLLDQGHRVRLLMGDAADQEAVADILPKAATARPHLSQERLVTDPMRSLHDLMRQMAETDVIVATRYHNIVCALRLGKPIVSLGYAEKNDVLMAEMGMGRFCQHVERLDLGLLIEQFTQLAAERQDYANSIRRANLACQERLEHQDSILVSRLLK
jgi:polysaccharide pyruvyl transferase WcaK-like protein